MRTKRVFETVLFIYKAKCL